MKTDVIVLNGQYASGKTTLIENLLRKGTGEYEKVGIFVAESANVAPDVDRYGSKDAIGVSFASVCCPTVADMTQALITGIADKDYELLFLEPPGNFHPKMVAQALLDPTLSKRVGTELSLAHMVTLLSAQSFETDKNKIAYDPSIEIASLVGITFSGSGNEGLLNHVQGIRSDVPVISVPKEGFGLERIIENPGWTLERMSGIPDERHTDHYQRGMKVLSSTLSYDEISKAITEFAQSGVVERAKGLFPQKSGVERLKFDIKGNWVNIEPVKHTADHMGYIAYFVPDGKQVPNEILDRLSESTIKKTTQFRPDASLEEMTETFSSLYEASLTKFSGKNLKDNVRDPNGNVLFTFSPIRDAYLMSVEIAKTYGTTKPMQMVLVPYHRAKLTALAQLQEDEQNGRDTNATNRNYFGLQLTAQLARALGSSEGIDYRPITDQHQTIVIKEKVPDAFWHYAANLSIGEISSIVPTKYEGRIAQLHLRSGILLLDLVALGDLPVSAEAYAGASNMVQVHRDIGFEKLASEWQRVKEYFHDYGALSK
jgi:G3E family GTPase